MFILERNHESFLPQKFGAIRYNIEKYVSQEPEL